MGRVFDPEAKTCIEATLNAEKGPDMDARVADAASVLPYAGGSTRCSPCPI